MEKINDEIFVGSKDTTNASMAHNKIKYCIYLSDSPIDYKVDETYPIIDGYGENKPERFIKLLESIDKQIKAKKHLSL